MDDIKIAAEIDLAGFEASREALNEVVERCEQKANLENESKQLHDESKELEDGLKRTRSVLERYRKSTEIAKDLLTPYNNEVIIAPIEWAQ